MRAFIKSRLKNTVSRKARIRKLNANTGGMETGEEGRIFTMMQQQLYERSANTN